MTATEPVGTLLGAVPGDLEALRTGHVALAGLYFDHSAKTPGARFAARQVRYESPPSGADPAWVDLGDLNVFPLQPDRNAATLADQAGRILATGARLLVVGGDYGASPGLLEGLLRAFPGERAGVIRMSRRLDLDRTCHGASGRAVTHRLASLLVGGLDAIAFAGLSGEMPIEEVRIAGPGPRLSAKESTDRIVEALRDWAEGFDRLYLSVDEDCVGDVSGILSSLGGLQVILAHASGHLPDLDLPGRTATRAIVARVHALAGLMTGAGPCR